MWYQLQKLVHEWLEITLGSKNIKIEGLFTALTDVAIWEQLWKAVSQPPFKGNTKEEKFSELLKAVAPALPLSGILGGNKADLLELLLRFIWKFHISVSVSGNIPPAIHGWVSNFLKLFPSINTHNWPSNVKLDEQLGVFFDSSLPNVANGSQLTPVQATLRSEADALKAGNWIPQIDSALKQRIACGSLSHADNVAVTKMAKSKLVRLFTSSTFTDTALERNKLMAEAYPFLRAMCQLFGYGFEIVDMRWGVREFTGATHNTGELCITELHKCLERSTGPAFITFLGDKYGYRPIPKFIAESTLEKIWDNMKTAQIQEAETKLKGNPSIPGDLFDSLRKAPFATVWSLVENAKVAPLFIENELLHVPMWYRLDSNQLPASYTLQNIFVVMPDYNSTDASVQRAADGKWWNMMAAMQKLFRSSLAGLSEVEQTPFIISITEEEVRNGILDNPNFKNQSFCVLRKIGDLATFTEPRIQGRFIDIADKKIDEEAVKLLQDLKKRTAALVDPTRSVPYDVTGSLVGMTPEADQSASQAYLTKFRDDFTQLIGKHILAGIKAASVVIPGFIEEAMQHHILLSSKITGLIERSVAKDIYSCIESSVHNKPLVITGESGFGKTYSMAGSIENTIKAGKANVVFRFLGATPNSTSLRSVLKSVCEQLVFIGGGDPNSVKTSLKDLVNFFPSALEKAAAVKPVVVFLDSLDQLTGEGASNFDWIPRGNNLPKNVFFVLSIYSDMLQSLFSVLGNHELIQIPKLGKDESSAILDKWLTNAKRSLTPAQRNLVLSRVQASPIPLYLKLCFDIASSWSSYTPLSECILAADIKGLINQIFERLEIIHGKVLLSAGLGSITIAKEGLSYPEVEDLLSCNERVLDSVYQWWTPPIRRMPPLIWLRIKDELKDFLIERSSGSTAVYGWYHRQFSEVAYERYCSNNEQKAELHKSMALYFGDYWNTPKPHITKGELLESVRYVQAQPLTFSKDTYNHRKLVELPYHQAQSGLIRHLDATLFNFDFIGAKCSAGLTYSLLSDYDQAIGAVSVVDKSTADRLLEFSNFIRQNVGFLVDHPYANQLAVFQGNRGYPAQLALEQWDRKSPLVLWKNKGDLDNAVLKTLPHEATVTSATLNKNLSKIATADYSHSVLIWDYASGKLITTLKGHTDKVVQLQFLSDNKTLLSFSIDRKLIIWDVGTMKSISEISGYYNPRWSSKLDSTFSFVLSADEKFVASGYGNIAEVWNIQQAKEIAKFQVAPRGNDNTDVQVHFFPEDSNKVATANFDEDSCYSDLIVWDVQKGDKLKSIRLQFGERVIWSKLTEGGESLLFATGIAESYSWEGFGAIVAAQETVEFKKWCADLVGAKFSALNLQDKIGLETKENIVSVIDRGAQARNTLEVNSTNNYRVVRAAFNNNGSKAALLCSDSFLRILYTKSGNSVGQIPALLHDICRPAFAFAETTDEIKLLSVTSQFVTIRTWDATLKEIVPPVTTPTPTNGVVDSVKLSSTGKFGIVVIKTKINYEIKIFTGDITSPLLSLSAVNDEFTLEFSSDDKSLVFVQESEVEVYETAKFTRVKQIKLDRKAPRNRGISGDLSKLAYFEDDGIVVVNLTNNAKTKSKSSIYTGELRFSATGNYIINSVFDHRGVDIVDAATGAVAQYVIFNASIDHLFVAGTKGLCVDRDGTLYFLALDF